MAKKMMNNMVANDMMGEIFSQILAETAKAGELERKIIEDKLFFGDVTDVADVADADDDADAADADYLGFSFDMKVKHGKRYNQKINRKNYNKRLYGMRKVSNYAHKNLFDHDEVTQISPVFKHREDEIPSVFIKKGHKSIWEKALRKVANRKIRYERFAEDEESADFDLDFIFEPDTEYVEGWPQKRPELMDITDFSVLYALDNGRRNPHLMTKISELSDSIDDYRAYLVAQIKARELNIVYLDNQIEELYKLRAKFNRERLELIG